MKTVTKRRALMVLGLCLLTVYGCGGSVGGGGSGSSTPVAPAATTTSVPIAVIDDAIQFATVCLDKNKNGACDASEPTGKTDAAGKVTLQVDPPDVGKFPILAIVGTDAVDAAYGPVNTGFTMTAPADQTSVVSPLTTLVQTTVATTGVSSAEAAASLQSQTGITVSLFQDFTKDTTLEGQTAGMVARMIVVFSQQQADVLESAVGSSAIDGAVVTTADLNQIIQNKLLEILPALVTALADPAVKSAFDAGKTPALKTAALKAPATALVADPATGLTATSVATLVAISNQNKNPIAQPGPSIPVATATLRTLNFTNTGNWFKRAFTSSNVQNTPDSASNIRYVDHRSRSTTVGGATGIANWNTGRTPARQADLHFTGTSWENCGLNGENVSGVRDASGNNVYNYCNNFETGKTNRATFNVEGQTMASLITNVRAAGYTNLSVGTNSADANAFLGTTIFPVGSTLSYHGLTSFTNAPAYYPGTGNAVSQFSAAVSNGGLASSQAPRTACNSDEYIAGAVGTDSTSFELLIASMTGTPCIYGQRSFLYNGVVYTSDLVDESWGNSTLSLGTVGNRPEGTGVMAPGFYSGNTSFRVAFKGASAGVTYYACKQRFTDGSPRNCGVIGTGSYEIRRLGDARVMTFRSMPFEMAALTFSRIFVERGRIAQGQIVLGQKIYYGYQEKPIVSNTARLNLIGANALLSRLTMPIINSETLLTPASFAGDWFVTDIVTPSIVTPSNGSRLIRIFPTGIATCTDINNPNFPFPCSIRLTSFADRTPTDLEVTPGPGSGRFDFLTGNAVLSYVGFPTVTYSGARR